MGILDLFRKPRPSAPEDPVRARYGRKVEEMLRAFDARLASSALRPLSDPPFEWVAGSYSEGPVVSTTRLVWTGTEVVEANGVAGLRALLAQARNAGHAFEELLARAIQLADLKVHTSRGVVEGLCTPSPHYSSPGSPEFLERFHPPRDEGRQHVFFAEAEPRPFRIMGVNCSDLVRVLVDRDTLAVESEALGRGPSHKLGPPPPGVRMPGRVLLGADGAIVTAPAPTSANPAAGYWRRQALGEHASIASFSRAVVELMAAAAPLELVERLHRAALDEVRHTRECLALARRLDGREVTLGAVPALPPRAGGLAALARRTLDEAAIPEAIAAATLARAAASPAVDEAVRAMLLAQAADEAHHAELAWDIIAWAGGTSADVASLARPALDDGYAAGEPRWGIPSFALRAEVLAAEWPTILARASSRTT